MPLVRRAEGHGDHWAAFSERDGLKGGRGGLFHQIIIRASRLHGSKGLGLVWIGKRREAQGRLQKNKKIKMKAGS